MYRDVCLCVEVYLCLCVGVKGVCICGKTVSVCMIVYGLGQPCAEEGSQGLWMTISRSPGQGVPRALDLSPDVNKQVLD